MLTGLFVALMLSGSPDTVKQVKKVQTNKRIEQHKKECKKAVNEFKDTIKLLNELNRTTKKEQPKETAKKEN